MRRYLDNTLAGRSNQSKVATHFTQLLSSIATQVSTNQESPTPLSSGFITMNSYNNQRNMSHKGTRKQAMPAPKLMAIENEYHRTKDALEREIKRLRGEVGVLAKRYNGAKKEIEDLVRRIRSQPPPPIPRRDDETERRKEERNKRWQAYLEKEGEEQEKEKGKKEKREQEKEKEAQSTPTENDIIMSDPDSTHLERPSTPLSVRGNEKNDQMNPSDVPDQTHLEGNISDVEMVSEQEKEVPKKKGKEKSKKEKKEKKREIEEMRISMPAGMMGAIKRLEKGKRESEYGNKAKRWEALMREMKVQETAVDMRWLREEAKKLWEEGKNNWMVRGVMWWDVIFYIMKVKPEWRVEMGEGEWILKDG